jgi:hypothetical protein
MRKSAIASPTRDVGRRADALEQGVGNDSGACLGRKVMRALGPFDRPRRHGIDPHPRPQFERQRARQPEQAGFRRAIQRIALERALGMDVGDVHDAAAAALEVGRRGLREEQRRLEVGADQVVPGRRVDSADFCGVEGRGVVHQRVEPAETGHGGFHQARQGVDCEQVSGEGRGGFATLVRPRRVQLRGQPVRFGRRAAIVDRDAGAGRVQRARDFRADATGGAGDEDGGGSGDSAHAGSIPARTRAAAANPKPAVTTTEEP